MTVAFQIVVIDGGFFNKKFHSGSCKLGRKNTRDKKRVDFVRD